MTASLTGPALPKSSSLRTETRPQRPAPAAGSLSAQQMSAIWKAAQNFEAMALGQLLQPMFATIDQSNGAFGGGAGEQAWQPMLVNEIARKISAASGLGLAAPIFNQMLRAQEETPQATTAPRPAP